MTSAWNIHESTTSNEASMRILVASFLFPPFSKQAKTSKQAQWDTTPKQDNTVASAEEDDTVYERERRKDRREEKQRKRKDTWRF